MIATVGLVGRMKIIPEIWVIIDSLAVKGGGMARRFVREG